MVDYLLPSRKLEQIQCAYSASCYKFGILNTHVGSLEQTWASPTWTWSLVQGCDLFCISYLSYIIPRGIGDNFDRWWSHAPTRLIPWTKLARAQWLMLIFHIYTYNATLSLHIFTLPEHQHRSYEMIRIKRIDFRERERERERAHHAKEVAVQRDVEEWDSSTNWIGWRSWELPRVRDYVAA